MIITVLNAFFNTYIIQYLLSFNKLFNTYLLLFLILFSTY